MIKQEKNLKRSIEDISAKNTDYKHPEQVLNQAESLKSLSTDLYTDNTRFIYELIQNADDAQATCVILSIVDNTYLIIAHDGIPFDEKDLQGLCGVNNGTKRKDLSKTGYKGLGFKAVFGKSENVIIYSNGEYFRFDSSYPIKWNKEWGTHDQQTWERENDRQFIYPWQINPIWTDENEVPQTIKDFLNSNNEKIHVANIILVNNVEQIHSALTQLQQQPYMFLFLRSIFKLRFITSSIDTIFIDCNEHDDLKQISINEKIVSQWIIKRFELDIPDDIRAKLAEENSKAPEKLRSSKKTELFFAAKYNDETEQGIEKLCDQESLLFSYLPTKIFEYKFPILINANFLTNANREQIHSDLIWNQWLFEKIGCQIMQWIKELVTNETFRFQAYQIIPSKLKLINNILSERFNRSFEIALKQCNFILNRTNQLLRVDEVIMDCTSMSEESSFINLNSMREYVIDNCKEESFQCAEYPFIDYDSNLHRIGVRQFTWHDCIAMFKSNIFLKTFSVEQNKQMIEYFYGKFRSTTEIEQIPFVMDQNNHLQLAKDLYFPSEHTNDSNSLYVHTEIFVWLNEIASKELKEWLQMLGLIERTDSTYLQKTILPNVISYSTHENTIKTVKMLFGLFQKNVLTKKDFNQLKQMKLLTTRGNLLLANQCFFCDEYNPRLRLEEYLQSKEDQFLSIDYLTNNIHRTDHEQLAEWRRFFSLMGVQEELRLIHFFQKLTDEQAIQYGFHSEYLPRTLPDRNHKIDAYSDLQTISFLKHTKNNYEFATFFWSYVFKNIKPDKLSEHIKVYYNTSDQRTTNYGKSITNRNYIDWFANHNECMPTTLNTCELANKVFIDTKEIKELCGIYMPLLSIQIPTDSRDWQDRLQLKRIFTVNDYFDLLEKIRHDENNLKNNLNRIQMIYSQILDQINSWSREDQLTARTRTKKVYLLAENNQWKLSNTLFTYIEDNGTINNNFNDAIPCLKLDYTNKKHQNIQKFINLFNIKSLSVKDLELVHTNISPAEDFRRKLIEILPFLKTWLTNLNYSPSVISSIDKILQEEVTFFEANCLELYYNRKFLHQTDVYHDIVQRKCYVTRPWTSEIAFMDLPKKICLLFDIIGFEEKIRFLLKAGKEEIIKSFRRMSLEIPTNKDTETAKPIAPASSIIQKNVDVKQTIDKPENRKLTVDPTSDVKLESKSSSHLRQNLLHANNRLVETPKEVIPIINKPMRSFSCGGMEFNGKQVDHIELIDISSISTSSIYPWNRTADSDDLITGYLGEYIVYQYLLNQYRHQLNSIVTIKWKNEQKESLLPYDILLCLNGTKNYIEVKSTRTSNKHSFPLSIQQIDAISEHAENYFIYRVYLDDKKLLILNNIKWRLKHKQRLSCFLAIE